MAPRNSDPRPDEPDTAEAVPSKSARKRAAHAAQDLGEALIGLKDAELDALELPERLREALREARRIGSRAGLARQRQYIGKLMREIDPRPIRATLAARSERDARETQRFKLAESWRERLLESPESALDELARLRPELDRGHWRQLVDAAADERHRPGATGARRELFRALRALLG
jgi:ribosome-associated protein